MCRGAGSKTSTAAASSSQKQPAAQHSNTATRHPGAPPCPAPNSSDQGGTWPALEPRYRAITCRPSSLAGDTTVLLLMYGTAVGKVLYLQHPPPCGGSQIDPCTHMNRWYHLSFCLFPVSSSPPSIAAGFSLSLFDPGTETRLGVITVL